MARRRPATLHADVAGGVRWPPAHAETDRGGQVVIREGPRATGRAALLWDHRGQLFAATQLAGSHQVRRPVPAPRSRPAAWWRRHGLVIILLVWAIIATVWR